MSLLTCVDLRDVSSQQMLLEIYERIHFISQILILSLHFGNTGKTTMACTHGGMCIHMVRALAVMEAKEAQAKEKVISKWT